MLAIINQKVTITRIPNIKVEDTIMVVFTKDGCGEDGLYYKNEYNFVICSNGNSYVQPCAPGTRNSGSSHYTPGFYYGYSNFCDVNLVDFGYAANAYAHGYGKKPSYGGKQDHYFGEENYHKSGYAHQQKGYGQKNAGYQAKTHEYETKARYETSHKYEGAKSYGAPAKNYGVPAYHQQPKYDVPVGYDTPHANRKVAAGKAYGYKEETAYGHKEGYQTRNTYGYKKPEY